MTVVSPGSFIEFQASRPESEGREDRVTVYSGALAAFQAVVLEQNPHLRRDYQGTQGE